MGHGAAASGSRVSDRWVLGVHPQWVFRAHPFLVLRAHPFLVLRAYPHYLHLPSPVLGTPCMLQSPVVRGTIILAFRTLSILCAPSPPKQRRMVLTRHIGIPTTRYEVSASRLPTARAHLDIIMAVDTALSSLPAPDATILAAQLHAARPVFQSWPQFKDAVDMAVSAAGQRCYTAADYAQRSLLEPKPGKCYCDL